MLIPSIVQVILFFLLTCASASVLGGSEWDDLRNGFLTSSVASATENGALVIGTLGKGRVFEQNKGNMDMGTLVFTASVSKTFTSAIILRLVDQGVLELEDHPQDHLGWWTSNPRDARSNVTIRQLLSFTSGYSGSPFGPDAPDCVENGDTTLDLCAQDIYADYFSYTPGSTFHYGPSHQHFLAAIAQNATGKSFGQLFEEQVRTPLGMVDSRFVSPSLTNPRPSGGGITTGNDLEKFVLGLMGDTFLSPSTKAAMLEDNTGDGVAFANGNNRAWHYGLSIWLECWQPTWDASCEAQQVYTMLGAFGLYAWMDLRYEAYGILVTQSLLGSETSVLTMEGLRSEIYSGLDAEPTRAPTATDGAFLLEPGLLFIGSLCFLMMI